MQHLEEQIAHLTRTVEELNEVVTDQAARIEKLEGRVAALLDFARAAGDSDGAVDRSSVGWAMKSAGSASSRLA